MNMACIAINIKGDANKQGYAVVSSVLLLVNNTNMKAPILLALNINLLADITELNKNIVKAYITKDNILIING